jgi:hypothetical protein
VVEATLANPVTLLAISVGLLLAAFAIFSLNGCFLGRRHEHVLRLAFLVVTALSFLTSVAVLATFEVVVLTFGALPTAIWELIQVFFLYLVVLHGVLALLALGLMTLARHLHGVDLGVLGRVVVEPVRLTNETWLEVVRAERIITNTMVRLSAELANGITGLVDEYQFS